MEKQPPLFGTAQPVEDKRRGRFVTARNTGTPYTPDQRQAALNAWWEENMQDHFPQLAQDLINSRGAAIASRAGMNVVDVGAEMEALEALRSVRAALAKTQGQAINSIELTDRVIREARELERRSGTAHLGPILSGVVVNAFADVRGLSAETRNQLLARVNQRKLPTFS